MLQLMSNITALSVSKHDAQLNHEDLQLQCSQVYLAYRIVHAADEQSQLRQMAREEQLRLCQP